MRLTTVLFALLVSAPLGLASDQDVATKTSGQAPPMRAEGEGALLEIRSYNLKPGARSGFHERFVRDSLPLLHRWKVDVVAYGPSSHDNDSYYLMRAFASLDARNRDEDAFYASPEWRDGPREAVLAAIENYTTVLIRVDHHTLEGLRRTMATTTSTPTVVSDLETLTRLNADYIDSVRTSDVKRFDQLLARDFLCTMPDGSLIDRAQFLENTAKPFTLVNLQAHDVNVRLMGDTAIVHARTTYSLPGGTPGSGRYTDVWVRRDGRWQAVAAHVTRK
jgi:ketosteroid isomerase-like protein